MVIIVRKNAEKKGACMLIKGLQKLTLLDYPDRLACTVFVGGCNFRCPFCHNASLVLPEKFGETISTEEFFAFLDSRVGRLDGVCVSGGEPTLMPDLSDFIREIKKRGFLVKLDTNGSRPDVLRSLIDAGLLDYVAMDIKNSMGKYAETAGLNSELINEVKESAALLMEGRVDYEFRTTLVRELHSAHDMKDIGEWLMGESKYYLQSYRDEGDILVGGFSAFSKEETEKILEIVKNYLPNARIRG